MPQTTITVIDRTHLPTITPELKRAMKRGVIKATDSGAEWIKSEVFNNQQFVGSQYYPDNTPTTKRIKAKKGQEKVGIMTGNLRDSFDTHYSSDGLTGHIRGGGEGYERFLARWRIDKVFYEHRAQKSREIMEKEIKKAL